MAGCGTESDDESLSPIFGFSFDEEGNAEESRWRFDPHLEEKQDEFSSTPDEIFEKAEEQAMKTLESAEAESLRHVCSIGAKSHASKINEMKLVGFATAAGKVVEISKKAVEEAKKKFEVVENEKLPFDSSIDLETGHSSPDKFKKPFVLGFATAAGKAIKVSEKAIEKAKKKFEAAENENLPTDFSITLEADHSSPDEFVKPFVLGFTNAAGKAIEISKKAVEEAKKKFEATEKESLPFDSSIALKAGHSSPDEFVKPFVLGFATAAGKAIKVSEKAVEEGKRKVGTVESESLPFDSSIGFKTDHSSPDEFAKPFVLGFATAAGKAIKVSEKAVEEGKRKVGTVESESLPLESSIAFETDHPSPDESVKPFVLGFATAAGKAIKVSEKAVEEAKKKFEAVENENLPTDFNITVIAVNAEPPNISEITSSLAFATAAGKTIKISEKAVEEAKRKFEAIENLPNGSITNVLPNIKEKKPIEEPNDKEKSLSVSCTSDVFDFGPMSPLVSPKQQNEIEDLTRSLLLDASTNDESSWDICDDQALVAKDSLAAIPSDGEIIPLLKAVVVRAYPIVYCMRLAGSNLFLSEKAYFSRRMSMEKKKDELREKLLPEIEQKIRKSYFCKKISTFNQTALKDMSIDDILVYLNSAEDGSTSHIMNELSLSKKEEVENAQIQIEDKIRVEVHAEFTKHLQSLELESRASPVFKVRVVDFEPYQKEQMKSRGGTISIWNPNEEILSSVKENAMFEFHSLKQNILQSFSDIRLSTTKGSRIHPTETLLVQNSFARKLTTIQEVLAGDFFPLFEEFDTVGLIIEVTSYTTSSGQMIRISDQWKNILKVKFWNSLKDAGLDDLLKVGTFIACINLQWRQSSAKNGMAFAQDVSCFQTNTKVEHLLQGYQDLCSAIKDVPNFDADDRENKNQNLVQKVRLVPEPKNEVESPLEQSKIRSSSKRRYLEQYGEPPDLPPIYSPAKRGRMSKKFVVPRRVDSKPPS